MATLQAKGSDGRAWSLPFSKLTRHCRASVSPPPAVMMSVWGRASDCPRRGGFVAAALFVPFLFLLPGRMCAYRWVCRALPCSDALFLFLQFLVERLVTPPLYDMAVIKPANNSDNVTDHYVSTGDMYPLFSTFSPFPFPTGAPPPSPLPVAGFRGRHGRGYWPVLVVREAMVHTIASSCVWFSCHRLSTQYRSKKV